MQTSLVVQIALVLGLLGCGRAADNERSVSTSAPPPVLPELTLTERPLADFTLALMNECRATLSPAKKTILSNQLARIASSTFERRDHQEAFILLVCIESTFNGTAKSKVGATGLSQLMPKYASAFAAECKLGEVKAEDLSDSEVNLTLGACHFHYLLEHFNGNVALALAGYNSGEASDTTKKLGAYMDGNAETMGYVAKFYALREASK